MSSGVSQGCLEGYRSSTTIVPQLGLSFFAAVTSTCDFYGDGDALGFPVVSTILPPLEAVACSRGGLWPRRTRR